MRWEVTGTHLCLLVFHLFNHSTVPKEAEAICLFRLITSKYHSRELEDRIRQADRAPASFNRQPSFSCHQFITQVTNQMTDSKIISEWVLTGILLTVILIWHTKSDILAKVRQSGGCVSQYVQYVWWSWAEGLSCRSDVSNLQVALAP